MRNRVLILVVGVLVAMLLLLLRPSAPPRTAAKLEGDSALAIPNELALALDVRVEIGEGAEATPWLESITCYVESSDGHRAWSGTVTGSMVVSIPSELRWPIRVCGQSDSGELVQCHLGRGCTEAVLRFSAAPSLTTLRGTIETTVAPISWTNFKDAAGVVLAHVQHSSLGNNVWKAELEHSFPSGSVVLSAMLKGNLYTKSIELAGESQVFHWVIDSSTLSAKPEPSILQLRLLDAGVPVKNRRLRWMILLPSGGTANGDLLTNNVGEVERGVPVIIEPGSELRLYLSSGKAVSSILESKQGQITLDFQRDTTKRSPIQFVGTNGRPIPGLRVEQVRAGRRVPYITDFDGYVTLDDGEPAAIVECVRVSSHNGLLAGAVERYEVPEDRKIALSGHWVFLDWLGEDGLRDVRLAYGPDLLRSHLYGRPHRWGYSHGSALDVSGLERDRLSMFGTNSTSAFFLGLPQIRDDGYWHCSLREARTWRVSVSDTRGQPVQDAQLLVQNHSEHLIRSDVGGGVVIIPEAPRGYVLHVFEELLGSSNDIHLVSSVGGANWHIGASAVVAKPHGYFMCRLRGTGWSEIKLITQKHSEVVVPSASGGITVPSAGESQGLLEVQMATGHKNSYAIQSGVFKLVDVQAGSH